MSETKGTWLDKAKSKEVVSTVPCENCNKQFRFVELKKTKIRGKEVFACQSCMDDERDRIRKKREEMKERESKKEQPQFPQIDPTALVSMIKSSIKDVLLEMKPAPDTSKDVINAINSFTEEIKREIKEAVPAQPSPAASSTLSLSSIPSERHIFLMLCENGRMIGTHVERTFGKNNVTDVKLIMIRMWRDNILWKDRHGWYMPNPEMEKEMLERIAGVVLTDEEYTDFITKMISQAIAYKFRPYSMLKDREKKIIEHDLGLAPLFDSEKKVP